jgi:hypothetical protein
MTFVVGSEDPAKDGSSDLAAKAVGRANLEN